MIPSNPNPWFFPFGQVHQAQMNQLLSNQEEMMEMIWTFLNIRLKAEPAQMCFGELIYIYPKSTSALFQLSFGHTNGRTLL